MRAVRIGVARANKAPSGGVLAALLALGGAVATGAAVLSRKPHRELRGKDLLPLPRLVPDHGLVWLPS